MARATWNGKVVAESDRTVVIENNHYFPPSSIKREFFEDSDTTTDCPWKGTANYFHLNVDGEQNRDAAWVYRAPKDLAGGIKDHVAFWRGVNVEA